VSEVVAALNEARVEHLVDDPELRYVGAVGGDGRSKRRARAMDAGQMSLA
jgi:hypothetical protein